MANCEKCGRLLSQQYAKYWSHCRECRVISQEDDIGYTGIHDIVTADEHTLSDTELVDPEHNDSAWIAILLVFARIVFPLFTICGVLYGILVASGGGGIMFIIGSIVFRLLPTVFLMAFVNMARDISAIRCIAEKSQKIPFERTIQ